MIIQTIFFCTDRWPISEPNEENNLDHGASVKEGITGSLSCTR